MKQKITKTNVISLIGIILFYLFCLFFAYCIND